MTIRACVIGYPARHSRSPLVHGYWLKQHGIDGSYDRAEVPPEHFERFLTMQAADRYHGANITVPHKEEAFRLARVDDPVAQALGAVNTVWFENRRPLACNTDVEGFLSNLDQQAPGWDRAMTKAVVLGAGGAARAVLYGLLQRGADRVLVINRSLDRARALQERFGPRIAIAGWDEHGLKDARLLVNTTSLGMMGQPPLVLDLAALPSDALVTDLVYAPLETRLLADAKARSLKTVDGLGMLLHQAVPGFERWFGVRPQVSAELYALVAADLAGPST